MTITKDDGRGAKPLRRTARSLLAALDAAALDTPSLPQRPLPQDSLLDLGTPGAIAALWGLSHARQATYLHPDLSACREAEALAGGSEAGAAGLLRVVHSDLPPDGPFALAALDGTAFEPGFARELASRAAGSLHPEGVLLTIPPAQEPQERWRAHLAESFSEVEVASAPAVSPATPYPAGSPVVIARRPTAAGAGAAAERRPEEEQREWVADFAGRQFFFQSAPGVFSPRGLDAGTRVMLEALLESTAAAAPSPDTLHQVQALDLGSGVGVAGVILASLWGCRVTATDVNARALRLTTANAERNGLAGRIRVVASDAFSDLAEEAFDLIVSHPPYHSDYAVARRFIEGAYRHLRVGGRLWLVVKRGIWYENRLRAVFGGCRAIEREGYVVLTAERRERPAAGTAPEAGETPASTRKHRKREEQAARRKTRRPGHH